MSDESSEKFEKGRQVKFTDPTPEEAVFIMRVVEDRGDRVLVETEVPGMVIWPTAVYKKSELKKA